MIRLLVFFLALAFPPAGLPADTRPNILFCIADDWSWPHAGAFGDNVVRTPAIDRLAAAGMVFRQAYCAAPSCTPSRAAMLTGRYPHQLEQGGNLWSFLPSKYPVFTDLLEKAGYIVGHQGKGWGPGNFQAGGRTRNPAGPRFNSLGSFLEKVPAGQPFFYWFGSQDPHRPYQKGAGRKAGLDPSKVVVPAAWPDIPEIRNDILDYYFEVERFDRDIGKLLRTLEGKGLLTNTVIVVTADNGMPFPRAKANLYDLGTRMPLVVAWPGTVKAGAGSDAFVNLGELAPTILEIAQAPIPPEMTLRSFLPLLKGELQAERTHVFVERERHANVRKGDLSYPVRAVRATEFLYIRNLRPGRWPAGDPEMHKAVGPYGDCDNSPTKSEILEEPESPYFKLAFAKRPAEELYHLPSDPGQTNNIAADGRFAAKKADLSQLLDRWMRETGDPRVDPGADPWSHYVYFGNSEPMPQSSPK